jgi:hypothetical protein
MGDERRVDDLVDGLAVVAGAGGSALDPQGFVGSIVRSSGIRPPAYARARATDVRTSTAR